jgi:hypothetical protein
MGRAALGQAQGMARRRYPLREESPLLHERPLPRGYPRLAQELTEPSRSWPSMDQWPSRAHEPHAQGRDGQVPPLRQPRPTPGAPAAVRGRLQPRPKTQDPTRPHPLRVHLPDLGKIAQPVQTRPVTPYSGIIQVGTPSAASMLAADQRITPGPGWLGFRGSLLRDARREQAFP